MNLKYPYKNIVHIKIYYLGVIWILYAYIKNSYVDIKKEIITLTHI